MDFWYLRISRSATVPGLYLCGFFTPPVAGADLRAALVASCLRGALPPVDLRAVCFVRAGGEEWGGKGRRMSVRGRERERRRRGDRRKNGFSFEFARAGIDPTRARIRETNVRVAQRLGARGLQASARASEGSRKKDDAPIVLVVRLRMTEIREETRL